jgi:hypothetical protein
MKITEDTANTPGERAISEEEALHRWVAERSRVWGCQGGGLYQSCSEMKNVFDARVSIDTFNHVPSL